MLPTMKVCIAMLAALGLSAPAMAVPRWELVSTSKNKVSVFLDVDSIKVSPDTAQAWIKLKPLAGSEMPFAEAVTLWKIDCAADTQAALSATSYAEDGSVRSTQSRPDGPHLYEPIVPGSYGATVRDLLCPYANEAR